MFTMVLIVCTYISNRFSEAHLLNTLWACLNLDMPDILEVPVENKLDILLLQDYWFRAVARP